MQDSQGTYCLIELQGELESKDPLDGQHLGTLVQDGQKVRSRQWTLTIGNHVLRGKEESLPKPLAIARKQATQIAIVGYVTKKLLFGSRPATIPDSQTQKTKFSFAHSR